MGNRYRCAGSSSETYIDNVRTYDRVDIKSPYLPTLDDVVFGSVTVEYNNLMYIANFINLDTNKRCIYTFDGKNFSKVGEYSSYFWSICVFSNAIYLVDGVNLYRLDGSSLTHIVALPNDNPDNDRSIFTIGNNLYLLSCTDDSGEHGYTNHLYRFTGSGWNEIATIPGQMYRPTCILYNNAIHILSYYRGYVYDPIYHNNHWETVKFHKIFDGSTLTDGAQLPGGIQYNAAYVIDNKLRIFCNDEDSKNNGNVYDLSGNTWSENDILNFDGWVNRQLMLDSHQAFYYKNEQYLLGVQGFMLLKIANPIRQGQYFIS